MLIAVAILFLLPLALLAVASGSNPNDDADDEAIAWTPGAHQWPDDEYEPYAYGDDDEED